MLTAAPASQLPAASPLQSRPRPATAVDSDGDNDNDARESAATQAAEARSAAPSLPTDPNRGRSLNITA